MDIDKIIKEDDKLVEKYVVSSDDLLKRKQTLIEGIERMDYIISEHEKEKVKMQDEINKIDTLLK